MNSSRVSQESYNTQTEEWTWTREVIIDGEAVTIREVNDTEMSYLEDMDRYKWYRVRYNAEGDVIDAEAMPDGQFGEDTAFVGGDWSFVATSGDAAYYDEIQDVTDDVENGYHDTIIYYAGDGTNTSNDFKNVSTVPFVEARTFYVSDAYDGVRIAEDVKVVFIQTNDNRTTTEYSTGVSNLEDALDELNADSDGYDYEIGMVVENSRATTVIIRDKANTYETPVDPLASGIVAVDYSTDSGDVQVYYYGDDDPTDDQAVAAIEAELNKIGKIVDRQINDYGEYEFSVLLNNGFTRTYIYQFSDVELFKIDSITVTNATRFSAKIDSKVDGYVYAGEHVGVTVTAPADAPFSGTTYANSTSNLWTGNESLTGTNTEVKNNSVTVNAALNADIDVTIHLDN